MPEDHASLIADVEARPLDAAMNEPFEIATGSKSELKNVLVRVRLRDGTIGYGESAPPASGAHEQRRTLAALRRQAGFLRGRDIRAFRPLLESLEQRLSPAEGPARAGLGMALADAWSRRARLPLRLLFGGAQTRLASDVTVTILPPARARAAARRITSLGVRTIKVKVGKGVAEDLERVLAVASVSRGLRLLLDANCGYTPSESLKLLRALKARGIVPVLFEQPAGKDDWRGLADVGRLGGVPVAADESLASRADALRLAGRRAVSVFNLKLMKAGLLEAWDIALIAKAAGIGLMIGGMVETSLAMGCAAHFAAGLGGFSFVDLDTPLWLSRDPMRGLRLGRGGLYDLAKIRAGIGVVPGPALRF